VDQSLGHRCPARVLAKSAHPSAGPSPPPPTFQRPLRSLLPHIPDGAKESLRPPAPCARSRSGGGAAPSCARIPPPRASVPPSLPATAPRESAAHAERPRPGPRPAPRPGVPGRAAGRRTMRRRCRSGGGGRRRRR
jgi:translation initiation factor IF-2